MILGNYGKWMWLTSKAAGMGDVVRECPQFVLNNFVLVTSLDSGLVILDEDQIEAGWKYLGTVGNNPELTGSKREGLFALSPRVSDPSNIPRDICCPEKYDEWYVFNHPPQVESAEVFVNWGGFSLSIGHSSMHEITPHGFESRFWDQLNLLNPQTYIAENGTLLFATVDSRVFEEVRISVQNIEQEIGTACDARSTL